MSEASDRGKNYEVKIQKITARILALEVKRDGRSGAGWLHKEDIRDRYGELPISVEIKNQESLKLKEWWRDANDKASVGQAPIVVFPMDSEDLCIMRYTDLLNIVKEMFDWRLTAEDHTKPLLAPIEPKGDWGKEKLGPLPADYAPASHSIIKTPAQAAAAVAGLPSKRCRNGHAVPDGRDKCLSKGCPFSATYKKPKEAKRYTLPP